MESRIVDRRSHSFVALDHEQGMISAATDPVYMTMTSSGTAEPLEIQHAHQAHVMFLVVSCTEGFAVAPRVHFMLGINSHDVTISCFNGNEGGVFGQWNTLGQFVVDVVRGSLQTQDTKFGFAKRFQIQTINRQGQGKVLATRKLHYILSVERLDLLQNDTKCEKCS
jgi:hypothetical protein